MTHLLRDTCDCPDGDACEVTRELRLYVESPPYYPGLEMAGGERPWEERREDEIVRGWFGRMSRASLVLGVLVLVGLVGMAGSVALR